MTGQPKVFGVKISVKGIRRVFPLNDAILCFGKCLNYQFSGFQRGDILLIVTILNEK